MPDMGIYVEQFPRVISDRHVRDKATPHLVERILKTYDQRGDLHALPEAIEARGGNAKDISLARMVGLFGYSDPRQGFDFMPWIHHIHGEVTI